MMNTIEQERVAKLIENEAVEILDIQYCAAFDKLITENDP